MIGATHPASLAIAWQKAIAGARLGGCRKHEEVVSKFASKARARLRSGTGHWRIGWRSACAPGTDGNLHCVSCDEDWILGSITCHWSDLRRDRRTCNLAAAGARRQPRSARRALNSRNRHTHGGSSLGPRAFGFYSRDAARPALFSVVVAPDYRADDRDYGIREHTRPGNEGHAASGAAVSRAPRSSAPRRRDPCGLK